MSKYLAKIIASDQEGLQMISACSSAAKVKISTIKFYVAQVLQNVLDRAVQVHGALGMTDDTPLASLYRHERSARIYDGADEVHKSRVAKEIMKQYLK